MSNSTSAPPASRPLLGPRVLLLLLTLSGLLVFILFPKVQTKMGLFDYRRWFLDNYAILASNDAVRAGLDPYQPNPLDDLQRPHSYSHWWFLLGRLGFTRADNFMVGGLFVLAFLVTALTGLRPRSRAEALMQWLAVLAPPVLLAIMRANNDLAVFTVLGVALLFAGVAPVWRLLVLLGGVALATGLKFYPAVAAAGLLLVRPGRRLWWGAGLTGLVLAAVVWDIWGDFGHAVIPVPGNVYSFGAPLLLRDLGCTGRGALVLGAVTILGLGLLFQRQGLTRGLADEADDFPDRMKFLIGAVLLVACFLAGISYAYRWVFALWLLPWLWSGASTSAAGSRRRGSRLGLVLLLVSMWLDGLFCLGINLLKGPMPLETLNHWQLCWRFASQPCTWLLMSLLAGWLLDAGFAAWRELREARPA
jgi:hypothetical protein